MKPSEFRQLLRDNEEKRTGDIYRECQKRGCALHFLRSFDTRMCLYPEKQTMCFIDSKQRGHSISRKGELDNLDQWKIYLEVYIELRPEDEKTDERKRALKLLENMIETNRSQ